MISVTGGLLSVLAVGAFALAGRDDGPWSGDGAALARSACGTASLALKDLVAGTRSIDSTLAELEDAADDARGAVTLNEKWLPVARVVEGARRELAAGEPGAETADLLRNCGMA